MDKTDSFYPPRLLCFFVVATISGIICQLLIQNISKIRIIMKENWYQEL